jgi:hypothetical protein
VSVGRSLVTIEEDREDLLGIIVIPIDQEYFFDTFPHQLLTVLAVMLSRPDSGRFVVDVPTVQVGSNRTLEERAAFEGYGDDSPLVEMRMKAKEGERQ